MFADLFEFQRDSDVDSQIKDFVQPKIVVVPGEVLNMDLLHIIVEGSTFCSIPGEKMVDAVLALLSTFYVFNISYTHSKGILAFLEETLLGLPWRGEQVLVSTFINLLSN